LVIGEYFNEDRMQKWFIENLPVARKTLEKFKSLNELFDGFRNYETKQYRVKRNPVLILCLPRMGNIPSNAHKQVAELERAIELFGVFNWVTAKFKDFRSRITREDYIQSFSACTELLVAKRLTDRVGKDHVKFFPKIKTGVSDILVELENKVVYLEVGNLGESLPEKKIQKILNESAKHLGTKIRGNCYFSVTVDTSELVLDKEGHIDERRSIEKITSEIDRLCIEKLEGSTGIIHLNTISYVLKHKDILEKLSSKRLLPSNVLRESMELIKTPIIKNWVDSCEEQIIQGSTLFKSGFICGKIPYQRVEIRTLGQFPSNSATAELESFFNHFIRHLEGQLNQLQPKKPNIILIHGYNWMLFGLGFEPLYERIQQFFNNRKEPHLSGVVFLKRMNEKAAYITNNYATEFSRLNKEDVEKLDFEWLET